MIFFSCRFAPNRRSVSIKIICRAPVTARSGLATFHLSPVASLQSGSVFIKNNLSCTYDARHAHASRVKADQWRQASRLSLLVPDHILHARKDCSAGAATVPGLIHEATRAGPQLPRYIPNNWERNGRPPAGRAKSWLYTSADKTLLPASSSLASLYGSKNLHDFCIQLRKLQRENTLAGMQHKIERRSQFAKVLPHCGTHAPANAIPDHRSAQDFADGKADSRSGGDIALAVKSRHVPGKMFPAVLVDRLKVSVLQQSRTPGEALRHFF
jgi:hypothetical protein